MRDHWITMGRTIPAWRMVVDAEMERMKTFAQFLRPEDRIVFEDMMNQCKLYASYASTMASPVKEVPLMFSILFGQHKMLWKHEKQIAAMESKIRDMTAQATVASPTPSEPLRAHGPDLSTVASET